MRTTLLALALGLAACGRSERADNTPAVLDAPSAGSISGPDQLVLRFPRDGGIARAYLYPALDSVVWRSRARVPAISRVLAFDGSAGSVVAIDGKGVPVRVDLRLGGVEREPKPRLTKVRSSDGSAIYGITQRGNVARLTPTGSWTFRPPMPAREIIPQPDGSLVVLADTGPTTTLWHLFPPDTSIIDSAVVPRVERVIGTQVGDRLYLTVDSGLVALRSRDLSPALRVPLERPVRTVATTPSGDRIYVATEAAGELTVIDRYAGDVAATIALPGSVSELRMDPLGRYVLARPTQGDSAWVIAVGTDRMLGTVQTGWRVDFPFMAPDGAIALLLGKDVVLVDGETLRRRRVIENGAREQWHLVAWNGFRPRATEASAPQDSREPEEARATAQSENDYPMGAPAVGQTSDRTAESVRDESTTPPGVSSAPRQPVSPPQPDARARTPPWATGFTAQFGALRSKEAAHELARTIRVDGATPRVVETRRGEISIYRVIIGPYATREQAETAAQTAGRSFWVYEGTP